MLFEDSIHVYSTCYGVLNCAKTCNQLEYIFCNVVHLEFHVKFDSSEIKRHNTLLLAISNCFNQCSMCCSKSMSCFIVPLLDSIIYRFLSLLHFAVCNFLSFSFTRLIQMHYKFTI